MAYLLEFLKCQNPKIREEEVSASPEFAKWKELREACKETGGLNKAQIKLIKEKEQKLVWAIWEQYQWISWQMDKSVLGDEAYRTQSFEELAHSPRVALAEIRNAAAKLSYMILPYSYFVSENGFLGGTWRDTEGWKLREFLRDERLEQGFYVLCPVNFYDIRRAEKETKRREVIFGGELAQIQGKAEDLEKASQQLSWIEEARAALGETRVIPLLPETIHEAAAVPDILYFYMWPGTSLAHGNEPVAVLRDFYVDMPEEFYLGRGFERQKNARPLRGRTTQPLLRSK